MLYLNSTMNKQSIRVQNLIENITTLLFNRTRAADGAMQNKGYREYMFHVSIFVRKRFLASTTTILEFKESAYLAKSALSECHRSLMLHLQKSCSFDINMKRSFNLDQLSCSVQPSVTLC